MHLIAYDHAFSTGYLFSVDETLYNSISDAYTVTRTIEREGYHPDGTAAQSFLEAQKRLSAALTNAARYAKTKPRKMTAASTAAFTAFGIAIGYASSLLPEQNLWVLTIGLTACTVAYFVMAYWRDQSAWDYGWQTLILALAAIAPLTPRVFSAIWAVLFVILGCVGMTLSLRAKSAT